MSQITYPIDNRVYVKGIPKVEFEIVSMDGSSYALCLADKSNPCLMFVDKEQIMVIDDAPRYREEQLVHLRGPHFEGNPLLEGDENTEYIVRFIYANHNGYRYLLRPVIYKFPLKDRGIWVDESDISLDVDGRPSSRTRSHTIAFKKKYTL